MAGKTILGLDIGTNSIGWAVIEQDFENKQGEILGMGSRIIPMTQDIKDEFGKGNSISQTAERTKFRSIRRMRERHLLRRSRLHRVLSLVGFLPKHYAKEIDFEIRLGQFFQEKEPKLAYDNNDFVFKESFNEMLEDFREHQPQLLSNKRGEPALVPYDWTIYYLRKKALAQKITKQELAWIILNFNQKRGYYQLRGEEDEDAAKTAKTRKYFDKKTIVNIVDTNEVYKGLKVLLVELEDGNKGKIFRKEIPEWIGLEKNIIATVDVDKDGNDKYEDNGLLSQRFSIPTDAEWETEWKLIKLKTEKDLKDSDKTVGTYIYDALLQNPKQKIKGKLVRTIERKFYKDELKAILKKQVELQPELFMDEIYNDCVRELYRNNEAHQITLSKKDFVHLFIDDIIFYQRPLKSQKSSISNCVLEYRKFKAKDKEGNEFEKKEYLKAIPKSHPLYQEFRVWQWLYNLKIYKKDDDADVTNQFIQNQEDLVYLFDFLMTQKEVDHKAILKHFFADLKGNTQKAEIAKYRWNYVYDSEKDESKKYPMNETGYEINRRLDKVENVPMDFLTDGIANQLWHIIYSVTDKIEFEKALKSFALKHGLHEVSFVENFKKFPPFKSDYGSFSEKAIKKLLPLMRIERYWHWGSIDNQTKDRIAKIINGEFDENMKNRVREKAEKHRLQTETDFQGLPLWLAQYVVYDRHSEAEISGKWDSVQDLEKYLNDFKQHSLRNPIVEQVITETLRVVGDIWKQFGNGEKDFFNEIHIELGREMKNTAEERKRLSSIVSENEATNIRIKELLVELKENSDGRLQVEDVRPHSPMQQAALKIFEDGALSYDNVPEDILKISKTSLPTKSELQRYKLWLEQRYRSPYTGNVIPLSKLFTHEYEIEHIIPQSRFFDDSFSNKIICESSINKLKDKQLGLQFVKMRSGEIVQDGNKQFQIFTETEYREFVKNNYSKNTPKKRKLLMEEVPDAMIERQLNDTRHISRFISNVLSNIVRSDDGKDEEFRSKNVLPGNGKITSTLKQDWGLNDVWNELILPRFERMNQLTGTLDFTSRNTEGKTIPTIPLELSKGFQKKRIDHRHHALDALIIACATRDHIQYLNNENAKSQKYHLQMGLARKLRKFETVEVRKWVKNENGIWEQSNEKIKKEVPKAYLKPWQGFTTDAKNTLEKIVISFKQNLRVINKTTNKYERFVAKNGKLVKELVSQTKGDSWAIRKSMHKDTVSGEVSLPRVKVPKGKILTATRKALDSSFNLKTIEAITDTGIQKILKNYLSAKAFNFESAFSPEGLEEMNNNIAYYNDGKPHQPIYKVRIFELGSKFPLGESGNKKDKFVEAAKGTNLFFSVYHDENGGRVYETIPLNVVIERQKQGLSPVELKNKDDFFLSPNDLVYVPDVEEQENKRGVDFSALTKERVGNIYKMVSSSGKQCFFVRHNIATTIVNKMEFSPLNKMEKSIDGVMIKDVCVKLKVDRLGNISKP